MNKEVEPRILWYGGLAIWFGSLFAYAKTATSLDMTVLIVYAVVFLLVLGWPMILMHWYLRGKNG